jgi:hypothetical protein
MRIAGLPIAPLFLVLLSALGVAQEPKPAGQTVRATAEQVERWAKELDDDQFAVREKATEHLIQAGAIAVGPVAGAVLSGSPEAAMRGLHVLKELALSGDQDTEEAARNALQKIADGPASPASRKAAASVAMLDSLRQERALAELEKLGAKVKLTSTQIGVQNFFEMQSVEIGEDWKGTEQDLRRLRWLVDVDQIVFRRVKISEGVLANVTPLKKLKVLEVKYVPVGDAVVEELKEMKNILAIRLYGTSISRAAADKLQMALANTKIDLRQGGFLGVGGQAHPRGFAVTIVQANSAADKAGIEVEDVILKFQDKPIADFEALTAEISKNKPGDTITLEILRNDKTLVKKIVLAEWDERPSKP